MTLLLPPAASQTSSHEPCPLREATSARKGLPHGAKCMRLLPKAALTLKSRQSEQQLRESCTTAAPGARGRAAVHRTQPAAFPLLGGRPEVGVFGFCVFRHDCQHFIIKPQTKIQKTRTEDRKAPPTPKWGKQLARTTGTLPRAHPWAPAGRGSGAWTGHG